MLKLMLYFKFGERIHWEGPERKKYMYYFFPQLLPNPKPLKDELFKKWERNSHQMFAWVFFPNKDKGKHEFFMPHMIYQLPLEMSKFAFRHESRQMPHTLWWIDEEKEFRLC